MLFVVGCEVNEPAAESEDEGVARFLRGLPNVRGLADWELPGFITEREPGGLQITTQHYEIYTTVQDPLILRQMPMLLESAFRKYVQPVNSEVELEERLVIYFFETRGQWDDFTRHWAGRDAGMYLQIQSGAYYLNGACVSYHIGRDADFSVLAHEGWHQFGTELFAYRLPAWLDEGLATNFEAQQWGRNTVDFVPRINGGRLWALREGLTRGEIFRLGELLELEPGGVLTHGGRLHGIEDQPRIATYYAQVYALVRFLREYDYGRYLLRYRALLEGGYNGSWPLSEADGLEARQRDRNPTRGWNRRVGPLVFERYIGPVEEIEEQYLNFCVEIASTVRVE